MKKLAIAATLALGAVALTGCSSTHDDHQAVATAAAYNAGELMFAMMMIPHHEQAVTMSGFAEGRTKNAEILAIASGIKSAQEPEIAQLKGWLVGQDMMNHDMGMDGMLTDEEILELEASTGVAFEKLYLNGMIKHHQGAISMLEMVSSSTNPEVVTLRENIRKTQTAEIKQMQELLKKY